MENHNSPTDFGAKNIINDTEIVQGATNRTSVVQDSINPPITIDAEQSYFSNDQLLAAAIFAFLPILGWMGIHDLIVERYSRCILHLVLFFITCAAFVLSVSVFEETTIVVPIMLMMISWVWSIVEGVYLLDSRKSQTLRTQSAEVARAHSEKALKKQARMVAEKEGMTYVWRHGLASVVSVLAAIVPIPLWVHCIVNSGGSFDEGGSGVVWWAAVIYYMSIGVPLAGASLVCGWSGLHGEKLRWLAVAGLCIKATTVLSIICYFVLTWMGIL